MMSGRAQRGRGLTGRVALAVLMLPGLIGVVLALATTDRGVGVTRDSVYYVSGARNLLAGRGLTSFANADGRYEAIVNWPPLYPLVLAAIAAAGADVLVAARWLSALLFGGTVFLVGLIVRRVGARAWLAVVAALLTAVAIDMVKVHAMAWSEPLCIFCGLLGLLLLDLHLERPRRLLLAAAAVALACAFLTRYAALTYIVAGALALLVLPRGRFAARLADLLVFGAAAGVPVIAALVRNALVAGSSTGRTFALDPTFVQGSVHNVLDTVTIWLLPEFVPWGLRVALTGVLVAGGVARFFWLRRRAHASGTTHRAAPASSLPALLAMFIVLYLAFVIGCVWLILHHTPLDYRILSPVLPPVVVLVFWLVGRGVRPAGRARLVGVACAVAAVVLVGAYLARAVLLVGDLRRAGLGYGRAEWVGSNVLQRVRELAADRPIYSNAPDAVYYFTGRGASLVPNRGTGEAELEALRARLEASRGVVVYFDRATRRRFVPPEELAGRLKLRVLVDAPDGVIYEAARE